MASLLQRYIYKRLFAFVFLVVAIAATLFFIVSIILWSPGMIAGGWKQYQIFMDVLCQIPWFLSNIYPAIIAVGTLLTFTFLAQHNELVVLRAAGLSIVDFIKMIFLPCILFAMIGFALIAYIGPMTYNYSQKIGLTSVAFHPVWLKEKNNIIYVKKIGKEKLYDITIFNLKKSGIKKYYSAKEAEIGNPIKLQSVIVKSYNKNRVTQQYVKELSWNHLFPSAFHPALLTQSQRRLTLHQLYDVIKMQTYMGLSTHYFQFRLWQMILLPIFTVTLIFSVIPFAFQTSRSRSLLRTTILGLVISIVFYFFNQTAWSLSVLLNLPAFFGVLIAPLFVTLLLPVFLS